MVSVRSRMLEGTWVTYHLVPVVSALVDSSGHSVQHITSTLDGIYFLEVGAGIWSCSTRVPQRRQRLVWNAGRGY